MSVFHRMASALGWRRIRFEMQLTAAVRSEGTTRHGLPQCEMSLLMWWTVPAPGSEVPLG
jgi:hypothetical protein